MNLVNREKVRVSKRKDLLLVIVVAIVVYANILPNKLVLDDKVFIGQWPAAQQLEVGKLVRGDLPPPHGGVYRPVRSLLYAGYYLVWGNNPVGYHIHSIMVIAVSSLLVYLIAEEIKKRGERKEGQPWAGWFPLVAALLFATHPIHTEAITYMAASMEMIGAMFFLAAFYFYLKGRSVWGVWVFSFLAFFTYEMTLTLLVATVMTDIIFSDKAKWQDKLEQLKAKWVIYAGMMVGAVAYVSVRVGWLKITSRGEYLAYSAYHTLLIMIQVIVKYLELLIWPVNLSYLHEIAPGVESFTTYYSRLESILEQSIFDVRVWGAMALIGGSWYLGWRVRERWPVVSWAIGWFYLTLLPVAYFLPQGIALAEKYLYLASVGWVFVIAYAISKLQATRDKLQETKNPSTSLRASKIQIFLIVVLVIFYGGLTIRRNFDWRDEVVFWQRLTVQHPKSALAHYTLGVRLAEKGDDEGAKTMYLEAVELEPRFLEAYFNLGNVYLRQGKKDEAVEAYAKVLELNPEFDAAKTKLQLLLNIK